MKGYGCVLDSNSYVYAFVRDRVDRKPDFVDELSHFELSAFLFVAVRLQPAYQDDIWLSLNTDPTFTSLNNLLWHHPQQQQLAAGHDAVMGQAACLYRDQVLWKTATRVAWKFPGGIPPHPSSYSARNNLSRQRILLATSLASYLSFSSSFPSERPFPGRHLSLRVALKKHCYFLTARLH
ncbi:hypothetical protein O181_069609 [Austropuccinia psidii MF-1]|uniref:Uncharacterized protein n=1 Tax=Austropuccinia psidii MF-1 TaxID=1389203 RepID=A0A9Q3EZM2_9BASI|nr:hypothetical protein [Austropuccinia psidii MF-1]